MPHRVDESLPFRRSGNKLLSSRPFSRQALLWDLALQRRQRQSGERLWPLLEQGWSKGSSNEHAVGIESARQCNVASHASTKGSRFWQAPQVRQHCFQRPSRRHVNSGTEIRHSRETFACDLDESCSIQSPSVRDWPHGKPILLWSVWVLLAKILLALQPRR